MPRQKYIPVESRTPEEMKLSLLTKLDNGERKAIVRLNDLRAGRLYDLRMERGNSGTTILGMSFSEIGSYLLNRVKSIKASVYVAENKMSEGYA